MEIRRILSGPIVLGRYDGCSIRINERHLPDCGSILIVADITELIQIEELLRESKFNADTARQKNRKRNRCNSSAKKVAKRLIFF